MLCLPCPSSTFCICRPFAPLPAWVFSWPAKLEALLDETSHGMSTVRSLPGAILGSPHPRCAHPAAYMHPVVSELACSGFVLQISVEQAGWLLLVRLHTS